MLVSTFLNLVFIVYWLIFLYRLHIADAADFFSVHFAQAKLLKYNIYFPK